MSTYQVSWAPSAVVSKKMVNHPLSPLSASEINRSSQLIRALYPSQVNLHFKVVTLDEPKKALLIPYLDAEHDGRAVPSLDRKAFLCYYIRNTVSHRCHQNPVECMINATTADEVHT